VRTAHDLRRTEKDHDQVKDMMIRIEEMSSRTSTSKVKLFEEMKAALTAHVRAEEKVFYDAIKREKVRMKARLKVTKNTTSPIC
jgi:hypothetical protein